MSLDKVQTVTTTQETPDAPISAEPTSTEFCHTLVHHYDFFGNPLFHKCAAPPATSLAIIMSRKRGNLDFDNSLHNAIVLWNALELIEPVVFWGPIYAIQDQQGTKLKEAATGQCSKLYATEGPWLNDEYDAAENKPFGYQDITDSDVVLNGSETKDPLGIAPTAHQLLRRLASPNSNSDEEDASVAKAERRRQKCWPRSRLCEVMYADDDNS